MTPIAHPPLARVPDRSADLTTSPIAFRKILVPVDFSDTSQNALDVATQIGCREGSELMLVHATYPSSYLVGEGIMAAEFALHQQEEEAKDLQELVSGRAALAQLKLTTVVEEANPIDLVKRSAEKFAPDLITMGSHATSKLEQLTLGSVAQSVVYALSVPTLIMGPRAVAATDLFTSILVGVDLSLVSVDATRYAAALHTRYGSALTLLHVIDEARPDDSGDQTELRIPTYLEKLLPDDLRLEPESHTRVERGEPAKQILKVATELNASLLVLGATKGSMIADHLPWATLSRVVHQARCGVLVIRRDG